MRKLIAITQVTLDGVTAAADRFFRYRRRGSRRAGRHSANDSRSRLSGTALDRRVVTY